MRTRNILLAPLLIALLIALCGCQPEVPKEYADRADQWRLADNTGCFMCHKTGQNLLGPAWENVSERYRNNPDAEAYLMNKIANGGSGAWISKDMPAYTEDLLTTPNRKKLAKFILSLR